MAGIPGSRPLRLRFHAVAILPGPRACDFVRALKGQRLLSLEAPRLPLIGCSCDYGNKPTTTTAPSGSDAGLR